MRALSAGAAIAAACAGTPPPPDGHPARSSSASASAAPQPAPIVVGRLERIALGTSHGETLAFTVHGVPGRRSALLIAADLLRDHAHVRRIDAAGKIGPVRTLVGRQPIAAFDLGAPVLLSSDGQRLCIEALDSASQPRCREARADAAVVIGDRLALLELRSDEVPDRDPDNRPDTTTMRLWVRRADANGIAEDASDSGLSWVQPLPGMGLADAAGTTSGARLVYFENRLPRGKGKDREPRAAIRSAALDRDGKLIHGSEETLFDGTRRFGFLEGHMSPRLFAAGDRAIYLGRFVDDRKKTENCEALSLEPRKVIAAPAAACIVDPWRLVDATPVTTDELQALERIAALTPKLTLHQSKKDAARVVWAGDWGYFVRDGKLMTVDRSGAEQTLPPPFETQRAHLSWGALAASGDGLALTDDGLVEAKHDGVAVAVGPAQKNDVAPLAPPVRIESTWWAMRPEPSTVGGAVVRLAPSALSSAALSNYAYADAARLVGGSSRGMFVALRGGRLFLWELDAEGRTRALGSQRAPVSVGFEAVARASGGALIVGPTASRNALVAVAVDAKGALGKPQQLRALDAPLELVELDDGALLFDAERTTVVWLDRDGRERARAAWPAGDSGAACVDGQRLRAQLPGPEPGSFVRLPLLTLDGRCMLGAPRWTADGSLRWFGSQVRGLDSQAELVTLSTAPRKPASSAGTKGVAASNATPPTSGCPPDMVSVNGTLCVDRFESQIADGATGLTLSPDYAPGAHFTRLALEGWDAGRLTTGDLHARAMPLPLLGRAIEAAPAPVARSRAAVRPSGYLSGLVATDACQRAGKRLCTVEEWATACRGEQGRKFPYGDDYREGACNVYRYGHPAATLHGNAAVGHLDPRLNRVTEKGAPLLRLTGATPRCASRWGEDAIYDMVGNLDEWVEAPKKADGTRSDKSGAFAGSFYSRLNRAGCDALITVHPRPYLDYSLGTRCCLTPGP